MLAARMMVLVVSQGATARLATGPYCKYPAGGDCLSKLTISTEVRNQAWACQSHWVS